MPPLSKHGTLTSTPADPSPAEHASIRWTHNQIVRLPRSLSPASLARPVHDLVGLSRDAATVLVQLERQGDIQGSKNEQTSYIARDCGAIGSIHATTSPGVATSVKLSDPADDHAKFYGAPHQPAPAATIVILLL